VISLAGRYGFLAGEVGIRQFLDVGDGKLTTWFQVPAETGRKRPGLAGRVARSKRAISLLLTVVLTAVSGQAWSWPWVLGAEPSLVIGSAGPASWRSAPGQ